MIHEIFNGKTKQYSLSYSKKHELLNTRRESREQCIHSRHKSTIKRNTNREIECFSATENSK